MALFDDVHYCWQSLAFTKIWHLLVADIRRDENCCWIVFCRMLLTIKPRIWYSSFEVICLFLVEISLKNTTIRWLSTHQTDLLAGSWTCRLCFVFLVTLLSGFSGGGNPHGLQPGKITFLIGNIPNSVVRLWPCRALLWCIRLNFKRGC